MAFLFQNSDSQSLSQLPAQFKYEVKNISNALVPHQHDF